MGFATFTTCTVQFDGMLLTGAWNLVLDVKDDPVARILEQVHNFVVLQLAGSNSVDCDNMVSNSESVTPTGGWFLGMHRNTL